MLTVSDIATGHLNVIHEIEKTKSPLNIKKI
jgi:hypothetical protein